MFCIRTVAWSNRGVFLRVRCYVRGVLRVRVRSWSYGRWDEMLVGILARKILTRTVCDNIVGCRDVVFGCGLRLLFLHVFVVHCCQSVDSVLLLQYVKMLVYFRILDFSLHLRFKKDSRMYFHRL